MIGPKTHKIQKTQFSGDSRTLYSYLPSLEGYAPEQKLIAGQPPAYSRRYNPLVEVLGEQMWECGRVGTEYFSSQGYVAYTRNKEQSKKGLVTYYRYDHLFRVIETGTVQLPNLQTGDYAACRKKTNAQMSAEILALSQRTNVMVAIYNDENPFPMAPGNVFNHTKVDKVYYYTQVDTDTPHDASGQYYPASPYWEINYHYNEEYQVTTTTNHCIASTVIVSEEDKPEAAVAETAGTAISANVQPHSICDLCKHHDELFRVAPLVYHPVRDTPHTFNGYHAVCSTPIAGNSVICNQYAYTQLYCPQALNDVGEHIPTYIKNMLNVNPVPMIVATNNIWATIYNVFKMTFKNRFRKSGSLYYGNGPPLTALSPIGV